MIKYDSQDDLILLNGRGPKCLSLIFMPSMSEPIKEIICMVLQLLDPSFTCQPKHVDLRDCSSGAVVGTLGYELELSLPQQHVPHPTSMPTQCDANVHSAPGPHSQHAPQVLARILTRISTP